MQIARGSCHNRSKWSRRSGRTSAPNSNPEVGRVVRSSSNARNAYSSAITISDPDSGACVAAITRTSVALARPSAPPRAAFTWSQRSTLGSVSSRTAVNGFSCWVPSAASSACNASRACCNHSVSRPGPGLPARRSSSCRAWSERLRSARFSARANESSAGLGR
jgi:hypothetical protein